jgi:hypothetical protein
MNTNAQAIPLYARPETDMSRPEIEPRPPAGGVHSTNELASKILI